LKMPVLEGSNTLSCTAFDASGSLNTVVRSIDRAGAPAYSVNAAIGFATIGATFCAEAVVPITRQKESARGARFRVIGDVLFNPRLASGKSEPDWQERKMQKANTEHRTPNVEHRMKEG
jgi:hypothetical protein